MIRARSHRKRCTTVTTIIPTNKWVLFGHHFAAISGAGPLIGPVLAAQFGFLPGLLWLVIGVCLGGAVHDFMILAGSVRRKGKSLAEMAQDGDQSALRFRCRCCNSLHRSHSTRRTGSCGG